MAGKDIVAIAGSAGAVQEILALVAELPGHYRGSLFIVVHTSAEGPGLLAQILGRSGRLPVRKSENGESIRPGHIYVAPPDRHLLVRAGKIELGSGPRENSFRPAADPLFRTAAHSYGPRVVGVVLSRGMSDGTLDFR
jgi:two-component system chemotaxis response regulator CheB